MQRKTQSLGRMTGTVRGCLLAGLLSVGSTAAYSYPTGAPLWGPTGLGIIPTTDTVPSGSLEIGLGYEHVEPESGSVRFFPVLSGTVGLGRAELGAGYLREKLKDSGFELTTKNWNVHAKYRLLESRRHEAALALGVHHLEFDEDLGHMTTYYAAASKVLGRSRADGDVLRGHFGVLHHNISDGGENETRWMAGLDWTFPNHVTLAADYVPRKGDTVRLWSLVARYEPSASWGAQIGLGQFRQGDDRFFGSLVYRFGGGKRRTTDATLRTDREGSNR